MKSRSRIDTAGRIVIPKTLRDRYGLYPGRPVTIVPLPDGVSVIPELSPRRFVKRGPLLAIDTGAPAASVEAFEVDRVRTDQLRSKSS